MSDTLAALQTALAPKTGMKRIPLPLESYEHSSLPLSAKQLINLMAEAAPADARTRAALIPAPGLEVFQAVGSGPIKAMNAELPGFIYVASGTRFYRVRAELAGVFVDDLGEIGVPAVPARPDYALMVTIAVGPTATVVCVPPNAFTCAHSGALNQLGGTFPGNASSVAYLDGYFAFTSTTDTQVWFVCRLLDPTIFDALDFATADAVPNSINMIIGHKAEFWLLGDLGHEVWYDAGAADFAFRRRSGGVIPYGVTSPKVVAKGDGSIFWLGLSNIVFRTEGYQAVRISTHAIEQAIRLAGGAQAAQSAFTFTLLGHTYYVLNFVDRTLAYDCATKLWHDRSTSTDGVGRWRANAASQGSDLPLLGDVETGNLFFATPDVGDAGLEVIRQMTMPPLWAGTNRAFCNRLELEMELASGVPGPVLLQWSDDGGFSWNAGRYLSASATPARRHRIFTTRLGSFRQRIFRMTTYAKTIYYGVDADISTGLGG